MLSFLERLALGLEGEIHEDGEALDNRDGDFFKRRTLHDFEEILGDIFFEEVAEI